MGTRCVGAKFRFLWNVSVTKLHFIAMAVSIDTIVIIDHQ